MKNGLSDLVLRSESIIKRTLPKWLAAKGSALSPFPCARGARKLSCMNDYSTGVVSGQVPGAHRADVRSTGAPGLSLGHSSPYGHADFYLGGQSITVVRPKRFKQGAYGGGKRGEVKTFSNKSRRRLFQKMGRLQKRALPLFVTLTYPMDFPSARASKRDLDALWKRVIRRFPHSAAIWKLEPQKRGAPHFHLLIWGIEYAHLVLWIKNAWYEVVNSGDEKHLRAGTRVEVIRSWRGALSYASKYIGKVDPDRGDWDQPGRFWGVLGRDNAPWAERIRATFTEKQAVTLIRYLRRACRLPGFAWKSLTVNVGDAEFWFDRIDRLL